MLPAVRDVHEITITFQLPCLYTQYTSKADEYIEHLVGHEGRGSLLSYLKGCGWATELTAGVGEGGYDRSTVGFMFDVTVTLTEAGLTAQPGVRVGGWEGGCGCGVVGVCGCGCGVLYGDGICMYVYVSVMYYNVYVGVYVGVLVPMLT